jgi:hypothetical protein
MRKSGGILLEIAQKGLRQVHSLSQSARGMQCMMDAHPSSCLLGLNSMIIRLLLYSLGFHYKTDLTSQMGERGLLAAVEHLESKCLQCATAVPHTSRNGWTARNSKSIHILTVKVLLLGFAISKIQVISLAVTAVTVRQCSMAVRARSQRSHNVPCRGYRLPAYNDLPGLLPVKILHA